MIQEPPHLSQPWLYPLGPLRITLISLIVVKVQQHFMGGILTLWRGLSMSCGADTEEQLFGRWEI